MPALFNADEIFEMAEAIERNGARFYRRAAGAFAEPRTKSFLLDLAAKEDEHLATFGKMRAQLAAALRAPSSFDPEGLGALYLQAMAEGRVFNPQADPSQRLTGRETLDQIFKLALEAEKNSIIYYVGLREIVPANLGRDLVDGIIREEMNHITVLNRELAALKKK